MMPVKFADHCCHRWNFMNRIGGATALGAPDLAGAPDKVSIQGRIGDKMRGSPDSEIIMINNTYIKGRYGKTSI